MNYIYEAEGKNRADAEKKALTVLGLESDDVIFKPVSAGRGLLSFVSKKPVVIRVFPRDENLPAEAVISGVLLTLIKKMGMEARVERVSEIDSNILLELESDDSRLLIGKQGRTLDSLQFILNLMIDSRIRRGKRIMIDVASYRNRRQKRLTRLAKAVADRVAKNKKSVLLEYMNPYERRIIHLTLEHDDRVTTKSDGTGVYKRVRILAAGQGGGQSQNQGNQYRDEETEPMDDEEY